MVKGHSHSDHHWPYIAIVAVVAIVAIALMLHNTGTPYVSQGSDDNLAGQGYKGILLEEGPSEEAPREEGRPTCEDSDPAQDPFAPGTVVLYDAYGRKTGGHQDVCVSSTDVEQGYCSEEYDERSDTPALSIGKRTTTCTGTCSSGVCVNSGSAAIVVAPDTYTVNVRMPGIGTGVESNPRVTIYLDGEAKNVWSQQAPAYYRGGESILLNSGFVNNNLPQLYTTNSNFELQNMTCGSYEFETEYSFSQTYGKEMRTIVRRVDRNTYPPQYVPLGTYTYAVSQPTHTLGDGSQLRITQLEMQTQEYRHRPYQRTHHHYGFEFTCP